MKRLIWTDGRLSWPLVSGIVFSSSSLVALDFVWRIVVLPIEDLLIYAILIDGTAAMLLIGIYVLVRRRQEVSPMTDPALPGDWTNEP